MMFLEVVFSSTGPFNGLYREFFLKLLFHPMIGMGVSHIFRVNFRLF